MENKENKQLNDEQVEDVAGGSFFTHVCDELGISGVGRAVEEAVDTVVDAVKSRIIPEPPKPNPLLDPNSFKIPDQYDPMK